MGKCFTQRSLGMDPVVLNPYVMTKIIQSISSYHVDMVLSFLPFLLSAHILGFLVAFSRPAHTIMDGPRTVDFGFQSCHTHRNFVLSQFMLKFRQSVPSLCCFRLKLMAVSYLFQHSVTIKKSQDAIKILLCIQLFLTILSTDLTWKA